MRRTRKSLNRAGAVRELLPVPVREETVADGMLMTGGDPGLVAVRVSEAELVVSIFGVRWDGPHTPLRADREMCRLSWDELPAHPTELTAAVHGLIQAAIAIRRAKFRECQFCQRSTPPEWLHDSTTCQACAERRLGVVH